MSSKQGSIGWTDLTVENAEAVRDFYASVVGWTAEPVKVEDHDDFMMTPAGGDGPVAGICHALPPNTGLPAQWLMYIHVDDVDTAMQRCEAAGGSVIRRPTGTGGGRFAVIRDPAGAVCALYQA
ncbi:VOC family protein [uncultured Abyssibacter sp.]|uniref:VOC family protein n=1 Tax=uncultured Abyssibacter sp. TaxID=2320202 RepID=UPI0032B13214